jgi:5'-nucleotidase
MARWTRSTTRSRVPGMAFAALIGLAHEATAQGPMRIVLTNDDGIEEVEARLLPVAERLRQFAEVYVVVSDRDRSGTSNTLAISRQASLESRLEYVSEGGPEGHRIEVHSVSGYPADCVVLAAFGILKGREVNLVISGPNGGANLADGWFGSGTIGAARTAAYLGLPTVAVSGLDSDAEGQVAALADWIASLARSEAVLRMAPGSYLTIGVPRVPPDQIRGVRVASRARALVGFDVQEVAQISADDGEITSVWSIEARMSSDPDAADQDLALYAENWIVVTPMNVDEHDFERLQEPGWAAEIPAWPGR